MGRKKRGKIKSCQVDSLQMFNVTT
uniref:Uncharacterized protein n=1 Tax=Anguilla anguilla TaxID=7936 RepID=A0A0E9U9N8_ANGAN